MHKFTSQQLQDLINKAEKILVLLPGNPDLDNLAAGLGLHLSLSETKKEVQIYSPTPITAAFNRLIGVDKVTDMLAGQNLVISLPDQHEKIERVFTETNQQTGYFEIIVEPRKGSPTVDHQNITFNYQEFQFDLIIDVDGAGSGEQSEEIKALLTTTKTIKIDATPHPETESFDMQRSSISENTFHFLKQLGFEIDKDIATNLLAGIEHKTANLTKTDISPVTFEIVALCLRIGAVRGYTQTPEAKIETEKEPVKMEPETKQEVKEELGLTPDMSVNVDEQKEEKVKSEKLPKLTIESNEHAKEDKEATSPATPGWLIPKMFGDSKPAA